MSGKNDDKQVVLHKSKRFGVGYHDTIGPRPTMEDALVIYGCFNGTPDMDYFAIFDGHGGKKVSHLVADTLHSEVEKRISKLQNNDSSALFTDEEIIKVLHDSFIKLDEYISEQQIKSGAAGLVALIIKSKVYMANIGDSRAVLCCGGKGVRLSKDHKPNLPEEKKRIEEGGGYVAQRPHNVPRVNDRLAMSRAFGDVDLGDVVSAEPFISITNLDDMKISFTDTVEDNIEGGKEKSLNLKGETMYLVMACDGLWDVVEDGEAAKMVLQWGKKDMSEDDIAKAFVKSALDKGTNDNVSVLVVKLN